MCYSNNTESTESKDFLRVEQPPSELRSALCGVNETSLSCRSEQCGGQPTTKFTWTWTPLQELTSEYCDIYFVL